jgi:hypothetical protein
MKYIVSLLLLWSTASTTLAQTCQLTTLKQGSSFELTSYDAKERVTGRTLQTVTSVKTVGTTTTATLHQQHFDAKNKPVMEGDFSMECTGGTLRVDMRALMGQQQTLKGMENMQVEMTGDQLEMPGTVTIGQHLPDAQLTMRASDKTSQLVMMSMQMQLTDRVVEAQESQTTSAGTFDCIKVRQLNKMQNTAMGIPMKFEMTTVTWYAPGIGQIRSESYRKDQLAGSVVMTKFSR